METTGKKKVKKRVGRGRRKKRVAPAPQPDFGAATKMETPKKKGTKKGGRKKKNTAQAPQNYFRSVTRMKRRQKKNVKKEGIGGGNGKTVAPVPQHNFREEEKTGREDIPPKNKQKKERGGRRKKSTVAPAPQHNFGQEKPENPVITERKGRASVSERMQERKETIDRDRDRDRERRMSLSDNCGQEKTATKRRASLAKHMQEKTKHMQEKTVIAGPAPQQETPEKPKIAGRTRRVSVSGRKRRESVSSGRKRRESVSLGRKRRVSLSQHNFGQEKTGRQRRESVSSGRKRRVSLSQHNFSQEKTGRQRRNSTKIDFGAERKRRMSAPQHNFETGNTDSGRTRRMSSFVNTSKDRTRRKSFREEVEEIQHRRKRIESLRKQIKVERLFGKKDEDVDPFGEKKRGKSWKRSMTIGPGQVRYVQDERTDPEDEEPEQEPVCDWRAFGRQILDEDRYEIAILLLTFVALFMEDVEILLLTQTFQNTMDNDDAVFHIFSFMRIFACILFFADLIFGTLCKIDYKWTLTWWLDFLSALSMIPVENIKFEAGSDVDTNYLVTLKAFKLARATRLLKMLRIVRLAKLVRLIRVVNLMRTKIQKDTYVIGNEQQGNKAHNINAEHLKEQLTSVITVKVLLMILMLMFGLPISEFLLGATCANLEKIQALVTYGMDNLHIMFSNTQFYENKTHCYLDPLCKTSMGAFKDLSYMAKYVSNITIAGKAWPDLGKPASTVFNTSAVRLSKSLYTHVCFVFVNNKRFNCVGCELLDDCSPGLDVCEPCFSRYQPAPNGARMTPNVTHMPSNVTHMPSNVTHMPSNVTHMMPNVTHMTPVTHAVYWFTVDATLISRDDAISSILQIVILIFLMFGCIYIFRREGKRLSDDVGRPAAYLAKEMEDVSHMNFQPSPKVTSKFYEIAKIEKSFREMKGILQSFAKFVPREVVRYLVTSGKDAKLRMNIRDATIFFSDIASFTTICESLKAQELYELLSTYFEEMSKIIRDSNGTLIEYIGDAILAVWNAPMNVEHHGFLGICSCLLMQERLEALQPEWDTTVYKQARLEGREVPVLKVRCGLHTSPAYIGNMGSPSRMKYGASGGALSTAGMLEETNKAYGTLILVSQHTYNQSTVKDKVLFRLVDYTCIEPDLDRLQDDKRIFEVVGMYEPLGLRSAEQAFELNEIDENLNIISQLHDKAFEFYRQRRFSPAAEAFAEAVEWCECNPDMNVSPKAAKILNERCLKFASHPPPSDWQFTSAEKYVEMKHAE